MQTLANASFLNTPFPLSQGPFRLPTLKPYWSALLSETEHHDDAKIDARAQTLFVSGNDQYSIDSQNDYLMHSVGLIFAPDRLALKWRELLVRSRSSSIARVSAECLRHNKIEHAMHLLRHLSKSLKRDLHGEQREELLFSLIHKTPDPRDREIADLLSNMKVCVSRDYSAYNSHEAREPDCLDGLIVQDNLDLFLNMAPKIKRSPENYLSVALSNGSMRMLGYFIQEDPEVRDLLRKKKTVGDITRVLTRPEARALKDRNDREARGSDRDIMRLFDLLINHAPIEFSSVFLTVLPKACPLLSYDSHFQSLVEKATLIYAPDTVKPTSKGGAPRL